MGKVVDGSRGLEEEGGIWSGDGLVGVDVDVDTDAKGWVA